MSGAQTDTKLEAFFRQFPVTGYPKGKLVIPAHAETSSFYYVETGAVKMSKTSVQGKKLVFHVFFPGTFFSLLSLVQESNQYDFITVVPTTVRKVPKAELLSFFKEHNELLWELQVRLLKGLQGLLFRIEQISAHTALEQVESLIRYFAKHFSDTQENGKILVKITHQEIADWLGLSRENVSIQMKQLEKNGVIKVREHFIELKQ